MSWLLLWWAWSTNVSRSAASGSLAQRAGWAAELQRGTRPLPLEVRLDAVAAVVLDGLSYRRTKDRLNDEQRACNRLQAGLRALVERSTAHLANAWALRR